MKLAKLISIGMLVATVMLFSGCGDSDEGAPKDLGQATYSISGVITQGTFTGPGLAGVTVSLESEATATVTATTGADGTYTFSPVSNGTYTITASLAGYDVLPTGIGMFVSDASVTGMDFMAKPPSPPTNGPQSRYVDNGNGTVTDQDTSLTWQKQDDGTQRNWNAAEAYCNYNEALLSGTGWRLPTKEELSGIVDSSHLDPIVLKAFAETKEELIGIVDSSRQTPAIDPIFTNTKTFNYWSSSQFGDGGGAWSVNLGSIPPSHAWFVSFDNGYVTATSMTYTYYVRCVRGGQ